MAVLAEDRRATLVEAIPAADPAPLGLAAFALTTVLLSGHNATFMQITEILLAIGFFMEAHGHANNGWVHAGGWAGIVTAAVAWYTSAAGVVNGMSPRPVLPVGAPFWGQLPVTARRTSPLPRRVEG
jgi:succinate-acetate transporter protein